MDRLRGIKMYVHMYMVLISLVDKNRRESAAMVSISLLAVVGKRILRGRRRRLDDWVYQGVVEISAVHLVPAAAVAVEIGCLSVCLLFPPAKNLTTFYYDYYYYSKLGQSTKHLCFGPTITNPLPTWSHFQIPVVSQIFLPHIYSNHRQFPTDLPNQSPELKTPRISNHPCRYIP